MKHLIKHTFVSTQSPEERDKLQKWKRYWYVINVKTQKAEKYLKIETCAHLQFHFPLSPSTYIIGNSKDKYKLIVDDDGTFEVIDCNEAQYMFTD